jgi:hypothetical protein
MHCFGFVPYQRANMGTQKKQTMLGYNTIDPFYVPPQEHVKSYIYKIIHM